MKRYVKIVLIIMSVLLLCAFTKESNTNKELKELKKYIGTYKYEYEYNTEDIKEDHYIIIENVNGVLEGRYYGTSDDFDEAREGYNVGFFVSNMRELKIQDSVISFNINIQDNDVFTKPIALSIKSSKEISKNKNPNWNRGLRKQSINYNGKIMNNKIELQSGKETRVFKKMK